jgi:hypothetical protein
MAGDLIGELLRMRKLYERRGPLDGQVGVTPEGTVSQAIRWSLPSVVEDVHLVMAAPEDHIDAWRRAMGLEDDPTARLSWKSQCPARPDGLTHSRETASPTPIGYCDHCGLRI